MLQIYKAKQIQNSIKNSYFAFSNTITKHFHKIICKIRLGSTKTTFIRTIAHYVICTICMLIIIHITLKTTFQNSKYHNCSRIIHTFTTYCLFFRAVSLNKIKRPKCTSGILVFPTLLLNMLVFVFVNYGSVATRSVDKALVYSADCRRAHADLLGYFKVANTFV